MLPIGLLVYSVHDNTTLMKPVTNLTPKAHHHRIKDSVVCSIPIVLILKAANIKTDLSTLPLLLEDFDVALVSWVVESQQLAVTQPRVRNVRVEHRGLRQVVSDDGQLPIPLAQAGDVVEELERLIGLVKVMTALLHH